MANVYLYVHDLRSSGVVRDALTLGHRLHGEHRTVLVAGVSEGLFLREAQAGPFECALLGSGGGRARAAWRLARWLRRQPPGLLVSLGNHGHSAAWAGSRGVGRTARLYRISNEVARGDGLRGRLRTWWMERLVADAARLVLVGTALGRAPVFAAAVVSGKAVALPSGVDVALARSRAAAPAPHPWFADDVPVVLGVGRLRPQKHFDLLIAAVAGARGTRRLRLAVLGCGTSAEKVRLSELAAAAGLGDDFLLAGETDNVFAWLARAAAFGLSSRWEGSSLALLEAMALDVPVVAARSAGDAADVLGEGRYGVLVEADDVAGFADALLRQVSAAAVRPGERARDYDLAAVADAYASTIGALVHEQARADPHATFACLSRAEGVAKPLA